MAWRTTPKITVSMVRNLDRVFSERLAINVGVQQPLMTWGCADLWVKITITVAF